MTDLHRPRPIPGAVPVPFATDRTLVNGQCPICESRVLWAFDRTEDSDGSVWHYPLDPTVVDPGHLQDYVWVQRSSTHEYSAITPQLHRKHVCPPEIVAELLSRIDRIGFYTAEILATPCPVRPCGSAPGMLCMTGRREALDKPHGARAVLARGEELEDPTF
ncbi:MAG: hypothetical protein WC054_00575 [Candidatus Nanopelagicales bacterium]